MRDAAFWKRVACLGTALSGNLLCEFRDFHEVTEELLGRPVFTHEMADRALMVELADKAQVALRAHFKAHPAGEGGSDE